MLRALRVRNLALLDDLTLDFERGLNVVTGETGAGKTLLLRAIALAAGRKGGAELVRSGSQALEVEAEFDVPRAVTERLATIGLAGADDPTVLVRRTLGKSGRGQVALNDHVATLGTLAELGAELVRIYGQHEQLGLTDPAEHLAMLDAASGCTEQRRAFAERFAELMALVSRLDALEQGASERRRRLELVRFELHELERARLDEPLEEASLEAERLRLRNLAKLAEASRDGVERLYSGDGAALGAVERLARRLPELAAFDPALGEIATLLEQAAAPLGEAARALVAYAEALPADPGRLDAIEERLAELARLKRKYAVEDVAGLVARRDALAREVALGEEDMANPEALRAELERAAESAWQEARELAAARRAGARRLETAMNRELPELGMAGAAFSVVFTAEPPGPAAGAASVLSRDGLGLGAEGFERAEFFLAANAGEGARPLARVASGGELSRISLALTSFARAGTAQTRAAGAAEAAAGEEATMIFDEVDAGIGGRTAEIVGRRLRTLAHDRQIVCITHLAQIAAFADRHYAVRKESTGDGRTRTRALPIAGAARVEELARMIGGSRMTPECRRHAEEMLRAADDRAPAGNAADTHGAVLGAPRGGTGGARTRPGKTAGRRLRAAD